MKTLQHNQRIYAIDLLRGMTVAFMILVNTPGSWSHIYAPLKHAPWHGCTPTDLVFPFFLFIVGASMFHSMNKQREKPKSQVLRKLLLRVLKIFLVGLALNYFPFFNKSLDSLRIFGVLQRIALAYGFGAIICLYVPNKKWLWYVAGAILLAYWLLLYSGSPDPYSLKGNIVTNVDLWLIGENHMYKGFGIPFDPEGFLSTFPAGVNVIFGYLFSYYLFHRESLTKFIRNSFVITILGIGVAMIWDPFFPINKPIWSSSYALLSSSLGAMLLTSLLFLFDLKGIFKRWRFFEIFGTNPLFSFVLSILIVKIYFLFKVDGKGLYSYIYQEFFASWAGDLNGSLFFAIAHVLLVWLLVYPLYKNKIFIKA